MPCPPLQRPEKLDFLLQVLSRLDTEAHAEIGPIVLHLVGLLAEDKRLDEHGAGTTKPPAIRTGGPVVSPQPVGGNVLGFLRSSSSETESPLTTPSPKTAAEAVGAKRAQQPHKASRARWQQAVRGFLHAPDRLTAFVQSFLLRHPSEASRQHARSFLFFLWRVSSPEEQAVLLRHFTKWTSFLPRCVFVVYSIGRSTCG